jgi:large subunit ribosomal protein L32
MRLRMRRAAHRRDLPQLRRDKNGNLHLSHVVDPATGRYRDRQVLTIETPAA